MPIFLSFVFIVVAGAVHVTPVEADNIPSGVDAATAKHSKVHVWAMKDRYATGEPITVRVSGLPGNENDWLGIFYAFDGNEPRHVVYDISTQGKKKGYFTFPALDEAHRYEVRAFIKGSFSEEDYYPFEVIENNEIRGVVINEVMAVNAHTLPDPDFSKFSDWIELYNRSETYVDISGYMLSDTVSFS